MIMYNVIKYSNNYSKTLESLWQYYRYEQALDNTGNIIYFPAKNTNSVSFIVDTMLTLKHLISVWKTLEMSLINFEINLSLILVSKLFYSRWYYGKSSTNICSN